MLNSEVLDMMMKRLAGRTATVLRAQVLKELNTKIFELEQGAVLPGFLISDVESELTVANQEWIDVPTGFIREVEEGFFEIRNSEGAWLELKKVARDKQRKYFRKFGAAFPETYALFGNRFYFGYTPDAAYSLRFQCYLHTSEIADNNAEVTNPWLIEHFNFTVFSTLMVVASTIVQSDEMVRRFQPEFSKAADIYWRHIEATENTNLEQLMGDEED